MRRKQRKLALSRETLKDITGLDKARGGLFPSANSNCRNYECGTLTCYTEIISECPDKCAYAVPAPPPASPICYKAG